MLNNLPSICKVPESKITNLGLLVLIGVELTNQRIFGGGSPVASQGNNATVFKGNVWLAGPSLIIGAGRSPTAVKENIKWKLMRLYIYKKRNNNMFMANSSYINFQD